MRLVPFTGPFDQHAPTTGAKAGFVAPCHRRSCLAAQNLPMIEAVALWMCDKRLVLASGLDDCALIASHGGRGVAVATEGVIG